MADFIQASEIGRVVYRPSSNDFGYSDHESEGVLPQVVWHVTDVCPHTCPYCFATKTGQSVELHSTSRILSILRELGVQKIDVSGGEPLLWSALPSLIDRLSQSGIAITLTTSGAGHTRWVLDNADRLVRLIVSIDGATPEAHDHLRGVNGTFSRAQTLVQSLRSRGFTRIRVNTVLLRSTLQAGPLMLARVISQFQPLEWCIIQPHPAHAKPRFDAHAITAAQFEEFIADLRNAVEAEAAWVGRLITRRIPDYSASWVLYPDGTLGQHSSGPVDRVSLPLLETPIHILRMTIRQHGQTLPMSEEIL